MLQRSGSEQALERVRNRTCVLLSDGVVYMSFKMLSSVFSVLVVGLFFGLVFLGCRGGDWKVQASPRHGLRLLHRNFDLGSHHVHRTSAHIYDLQVRKMS